MDFDRWLEAELEARDRASSAEPRPSPRYAAPTRRNPMLKALAALAGSKAALAGTAAVALAATGVGVKTATTGSPNPLSWGAQVTQQVQTCKAARTDLQHGHGIGQCLSAFAKP